MTAGAGALATKAVAAATNIGPMPGIIKKAAPNNHPQIAPQKAPCLAPVLHAVAGVIVTDDVLVGMIILADNGHFLHIKPGPLQFLDRFLCCGVGLINSYYRVHFRHCLMFLPFEIELV